MSHAVLAQERHCKIDQCGKFLTDEEQALAYHDFDAPLCYRHQVLERCGIPARATREEYLQRSGQIPAAPVVALEHNGCLIMSCGCGDLARWMYYGDIERAKFHAECWRCRTVTPLGRREAQLLRQVGMDYVVLAEHIERQ